MNKPAFGCPLSNTHNNKNKMETQRNSQLMYNNTGSTRLVTDYATAPQSLAPRKITDDTALADSLKLRELIFFTSTPGIAKF